MEEMITKINGWLWSPVLIYGILVVGLIFTFSTKFMQVRFFKDMFVQLTKGEKSSSGVSSFEALSMALAGRIGVGNIAGTATAIAYGGPGSIFWMWVLGFIGTATSYVESTLAQIYKDEKNGIYRGGPAYYLYKFTQKKWIGTIFAIVAVIAMAALMPSVQSNSIAGAMNNAFHLPAWITGVFLVVLIGVIIFGGVRRIAAVASIVVPFMAGAYILMAILIIILNFDKIPNVFGLIFSSAFGQDKMFGGILGAAIAWGVKRGIYANEAGQGTGPHHAAAAEVSHPVKQGFVQAFSIYFDTFLVCTATAFIILFTGAYNVQNESTGKYLVQNIPGVQPGEAYTQAAIEQAFPLAGFGSGFIAIALLFFAFTTIMAYYYIAETNLAFMLDGAKLKVSIRIMQVVFLILLYFGSVKTATTAWALGDTGLGLMVYVNVISLLFLLKPALVALKDYEAQKKQGIDPVFDPRKLGIKNADYWEKRIDEEK
ncbi:alanine/glycine:cation symporter family protein [Rummeliibacillus suwonensis]|uniref:alanine/glycine:cation symporter family protein n=1 Tax=Rummeliibacillus suwonensis TaxID=1306154 RepID=UPI0011B5A216|nr:alanine/glycine:cation symporter family protein [Rummeliibacillus suwonensis]MBO2536245.1 alanine:cation symporter family protein [Rummeliibacillus suwonensis]